MIHDDRAAVMLMYHPHCSKTEFLGQKVSLGFCSILNFRGQKIGYRFEFSWLKFNFRAKNIFFVDYFSLKN